MHHQKKLLNGLIKKNWGKLMALPNILMVKIGYYSLKKPPVLAVVPVDLLILSQHQVVIKLSTHLFVNASL